VGTPKKRRTRPGALDGSSQTPAQPAPYRVAVSGHRGLGTSAQQERLRSQCRQLLMEIKAQHPDIEALTAIAEGADSLFAETALELGIPLRVVLPFATYIEDFPEGPARQRFLRLQQAATSVETLNYAERSDDAYFAGGLWVVDRANLLVALWDGQPARGHGGTAEIVDYARSKHIPVEVLPVKR
jgi:hypothetical protein